MPERASVVIAQPLPVIEAMLWDVASWPSFLRDVEDTRRIVHDQYQFTVRRGRRVREVVVQVRWRACDHRFSWQALDGPAWSGELELIALTGRRTAVRLVLADPPPGLCHRAARLLGCGRQAARNDLRALCRRADALPQPVRPQRLRPAVDRVGIGDIATVAAVRVEGVWVGGTAAGRGRWM